MLTMQNAAYWGQKIHLQMLRKYLNEICDGNLAYLSPAPDKRLTSPGEHILTA